jgi:molybdenum cofactor cytidylyltransferase
MIGAERTVLALLAAGRSTRFGGSKLDAELWGKAVGLHAAEALAALPFLARVAVTGDARLDYAALGFEVVANADPERDQASSLRLAARHAIERKADAVLIVLADMPCVTAAHVRGLLAAADGAAAVVGSSDGGAPKPPALFGRDRLAELLAMTGDRGARDLIRAGRLVAASPAELVDIDTREELAALAATRTNGRSPPAKAVHST